MKALSLVIGVIAPIIVGGVWLGTLQSKADTNFASIKECKENFKVLDTDLRRYMQNTEKSLTLIKYKLNIKD